MSLNLSFDPCVQNEKNDYFDKVIHITYKNIEKLETVKNQWLTLNPNYRVELYDDNRCTQFLTENFGKTYSDIFNYIKDGPIKSDFFRICILYIHGGVYVDADIRPLVPLDDFIEHDIDFATCISYNYKKNSTSYKYNPHFIVSRKYNSYLYNAIKQYELLYEKQTYSYWDWSICKLFIMDDFSNFINGLHNSFVLNDKKYIFLIEKVVGDNDIAYDFTNIMSSDNKLKFNYSKSVYCEYNGKIVLENFTNKPNL